MAGLNNSTNQKTSDLVHEAAMEETAAVMQRLRTSPSGLTEAEAATRLEIHGPNEVAHERQQSWLYRLYIAARNPLVILLTILAIISFVAPQGDVVTGIIMLVMVGLGLSLR